MSTLAFATGGQLHQTQFVIVNDRLPRTDEHCALCGGRIEKGYLRASRTRLIYCDKPCFAGAARMALPIVKTCESKMVAGEAPWTVIAGSPDELNFQNGFVGNPMNRRISARGVCRSASDGAAEG